MSYNSTLRSALQAAIKTPANPKISGAILQQQLLSIVDAIDAGAQFLGIATSQTNPNTEAHGFYFAATEGTYLNFGGLQVAANELAIFEYNGSSWTKTSLLTGSGGAGASSYNDLSNKPQINGIPLQGNMTYEDLSLQERIVIVSDNANLYDPNAVDVLDEHYMLQNENGFRYYSNPIYKVSGFIPVIPGITYTAWHAHDYAFFDSKKDYINDTCAIATNYTTATFTPPVGAAYVRVTFWKEDDSTNRMNEGDTLKDYEPYGEGVKLDLPLSAMPNHEQLEKLIGRKSIINAGVMAAGDSLTLDSFPRYLQAHNTIAFRAKFDSFAGGTLKIGKGFSATPTFGASWFEIDETNVVLKKHENSDSTIATNAHSLTLSTFIDVLIQQGSDDVTITINTLDGMFTHTYSMVGGFAGIVKAEITGTSLSDCVITAANKSGQSNVWMFGDSYFGLSDNKRVGYWLKKFGVTDNVLYQYFSGQGSSSAEPDLERALNYYGAPKFIVWGLGMNDDNANDLADITTGNWYLQLDKMLKLCKKYGITPILTTVPQVRSASYKNKDLMSAWVRGSGYSYVDVSAAVGADSNGEWYGNGTADDYQSTDNVHPTELGAKAIALSYLNEAPVMLQFGRDFDAAERDALHSGITASKVTKLDALPTGARIVSITYADLKALRNGSNLVPGTWYRITDYACTTTQENTKSANHAFDIIVRADDASHLNENAYAAHHAGDTYFATCKLEAWELKYSLDNDTNRFVWADEEKGKGVIFYMKDEWGNIAPFDFKNMLFTRDSEWFGDHEKWAGDVLGEVPETDLHFYFLSWVTEDGEVQDASIVGQTLTNDEGVYTGVYDNEIKETTAYDMGITEDATSTAFALPYTIIVSSYAYEYGVFYGCYGNKFGNDCSYNSFGNGCSGNTFGNNCYDNTFGNDCSYNSFGNNCQNNTLGNGFQNNTFGNNCYNNTFGNYFNSNSFGNSCGGNTFGNDCDRNSFGNGCGYNSFGNECFNNSFGNNCYNNTFGNYCQTITVFDGVQNCSVTGGSQSAPVKNAQILNGTAGDSDQNKLTIAFAANKAYTQVAAKTTAGNLQIFNPADLVQ